MDRHNLGLIFLQPIDETVTSQDDLAHRGIPEFGHHPAESREFRDAISGLDRPTTNIRAYDRESLAMNAAMDFRSWAAWSDHVTSTISAIFCLSWAV